MLKLNDIRKSYTTADFTQVALDGVSVTFRDNEFAAILGPSGSGKTTMLNIIGGLDQYDSGDLVIDGISTKEYKDSDWDAYRNNRIGFVFQSYNLIPHQTILANVELALTLSGVSPAERASRAKEALGEVGLADHVHKLPSQLSGGQMQRVAIARALINDPEILLADEPTGALDSKTSVQVMDLLTQIAQDRLVIMVTHNNELAEEYANRIIELKDGHILSDTNPVDPLTEKEREGAAAKKVSMSFLTAVSLSFSNLKTKLGRTFMICLAGSIGIIGIAAILALASGINLYIKNTEEETMSIYPLTIQESGMDLSSFLGGSTEGEEEVAPTPTPQEENKENSNEVREVKFVKSIFNSRSKNDLKSLKSYIDDHRAEIDPYAKSIQYQYNITPQIFLPGDGSSINQVNPDLLLGSYTGANNDQFSQMFGGSMSMGMDIASEMPEAEALYEEQYDVKAGRWPEKYDETVLVLGSNGRISDYTLYCLGLRDRNELKEMLEVFTSNPDGNVKTSDDNREYTMEELMSADLRVINQADRYVRDDTYNIWVDKSDNAEYMKNLVDKGLKLKIVGVVQPNDDEAATTLTAGLNYRPDLIEYLMKEAAGKEIVKEQLAKGGVNVFTGKTFVQENSENADSDLDFADMMTIDESALQSAFKFDESALTTGMDLSSFGNFSLDTSQIPAPNMDLNSVIASIAGQVQVPTEQLTALVDELLKDFIAEEVKNGVNDPNQWATDFVAYVQRPEVQKKITDAVGNTGISDQLATALQSSIQGTLTDYVTQTMGVLQTQIAGQLQSQMTSAFANLPSQLQNAMSIDEQAFMQAFQFNMSEEEMYELMSTMMSREQGTQEKNLSKLGYADPTKPSQINIYSKDFNSKDEIDSFLQNYNDQMKANGEEDKAVSYTDIIKTMMSSVTRIVDMISNALIAFVSISLIVSSIMIGVITYISVLERKKEIGILRAIGASKRDIRRVFNAETLIIGFVAGLLGVGVTYILSFFANIIVEQRMGVENITHLPITAALVLIGISMFLAFISGLLPSASAAKKDPVEALRSE